MQIDLESKNYEVQALAVTAIANIGGRRLAQQFGDSIVNIMMSQYVFFLFYANGDPSSCFSSVFILHSLFISKEFFIIIICLYS